MSGRSPWAVAALLVAMAGCNSATPPPSSWAAEGSGTTAPASRSEIPSTQPSDNRTLSLDWESVDQSFTTPLLDVRSDGGRIAWSSGAADGPGAAFAPDLYVYVPGGSGPEPVFINPHRDSNLMPIDVAGDFLAFVETNESVLPDGWRLWLLRVHQAPVLLDESEPGTSTLLPSLDLQPGRIVWTAFHIGPNDVEESGLWIAEAPVWEPRPLITMDARDRELWLPSLDGDALAYVTVDYSADRTSDERHVELLDLGSPAEPPRRLDSSGVATMPQVRGDRVVWKETTRADNMFNWGQLVVYTLSTGELEHITLGNQPRSNYPSLGDRYIAAWGWDPTIVTMYDLAVGASVEVARYDPTGGEGIRRPFVAGDLLTFLYHATADADLELRWAWLSSRANR